MRAIILSTFFGGVETAVREQAAVRGHVVEFFHPQDLPLQISTACASWAVEDFRTPDVALVRRTRHHFEASITVAQLLVSQGVPLVDPLPTLLPPISKSLEALSLAGLVTQPKSMVVWARESVPTDLSPLKFPLFIKPTTGWSGEGVRFVQDAVEFGEVMSEWRQSRGSPNLILQEAVHGQEYRCAVVGNRCWLSKKESGSRIQTARAGTQFRVTHDSNLEALSVKVAVARGLDIAAIDWIVNDAGTPVLLECNRNPGFPRKAQFEEVIGAIVDLLEARSER